MGTIERVEFGHIAAEEEAKELQGYFIETDEYRQLVDDPKRILVVGRKGSGKSAIFYAMQERLSGRARGLTLDDYPWQIHKRLRDESGAADYAYVNTWRYVLLVELAKHIVNYTELRRYKLVDINWWLAVFSANRRKIKRFLKVNYGSLAPSFTDLLVDKARRVKSLKVQALGAEVSVGENQYSSLIVSMNIAAKELQSIVLGELRGTSPIYLLLDRLDRGWDNSERVKQMLVGLILASRDLVRAAALSGRQLHIVVFLRSDIYALLRFEDKNKLSPDIISLTWDSVNLRSLVDERIRVSADATWDDIVTSDRMRRQMEPFNYIIKRTMLRPRDLIQFCIDAQKEALSKDHSRIDKEDIYGAERSYSQYMKREFQDEMQSTCLYLDRLFDVLRSVGAEKLSVDEFHKAYADMRTADMPADPAEALQLLIELSILGVQRAGGRTGGSQILYRYLVEPEARIDPAGTMTVHPALKYALNLTETRRRRK